jgi:nitroreductase
MSRPPHETAHPVHDLIRRRWSPRAFSDRPVEPEKLLSVLEAARWAPSSFNEQPWRFLVATRQQPDEFARMLACLTEKNQAWARGAAVLMIACAQPHFSHNDKPNRHALYDTGAAVAFLTMQATELSLHLHQMAGFSPERARETYQIPATVEPVAAIAMGYLGDPSSLPEDLRQRELKPGTRRPLAELVFAGSWGKTAPFASAQPSQ